MTFKVTHIFWAYGVCWKIAGTHQNVLRASGKGYRIPILTGVLFHVCNSVSVTETGRELVAKQLKAY